MSDYRCTPYCPPFGNIKNKKTALLRKIRLTHPRAQNIYNIIKGRGSKEHVDFLKIYNYKCCYCGCSVKILSAMLFEVDHLKPISSSAEPTQNLNGINNLVLSCRNCNGWKLAYYVDELSDAWSPDNEGISQLFNRDHLYNICIDEKYQANDHTIELYDRLKLGAQFRRLDYLLMSIDGYIKKHTTETRTRTTLLELFAFLHEKRNFIGI